MNQGKVILAIKALDKLKNQQMPLQLSYKVYKLRKELQTHWDWQVEKEMELLERFGEPADNGMVVKQDSRADFNSALNFISFTEVEQDWTPIRIPMSTELKISAEDIDALDGFITIGDDEQ